MNSKKELSFQELFALYSIARVAADKGNSLGDSIVEIIKKIESETEFRSGVIEVHSGSELAATYSAANSDNISTYQPAINEVTKTKKPFVQAGFSTKKVVKLKVGQTLFAIPILHDRHLSGAISFTKNSVSNRDELDRDISFLTQVADFLAETVIERVELESSIESLALENSELKKTLTLLENSGRSSEIIGNSKVMRQLYTQIAQVAGAETTVLVRGETGTGKELVAKSIHAKSERATGPFVAVNCAALPHSLLESELFGYEKGAFTGAIKRRAGSFEQADGGTLFLDEIGEMSFEAQARLLRVIQEREVVPIGSVKPISVNTRLICATNKNLEKAVKEGKFREDLYYRIDVFSLALPLLSERLDDIPELVEKFIEIQNRVQKRSITGVSDKVMKLFINYPWPGNVRELQNTIERSILVTTGNQIEISALPPKIAGEMGSPISTSFENRVADFERELIEEALEQSSGNQTEAAEILETTKRVIQYKISKLDIDFKRFKK